jgi:uncharacterized protein YggE
MSSRRLIAASCLLLALTAIVAAQERALMAQPNTVSVGADGKFESAPDTALIQFNISAQDETSKAAYDRASRAADRVRQILKSNGIDPKTAEVGFYSLEPVYDWRNPKRKLVGYRVSTSVSLKLKDFSKVGPLVQQFSDVEGNENQTLSYTLENLDEAKQKAVQDALARARASAQTVAQSSGRNLSDLLYASVDTFEPPRLLAAQHAMGDMRMMKAEAAPAAPTAEFSPQKITVTAHVNAVFGLK